MKICRIKTTWVRCRFSDIGIWPVITLFIRHNIDERRAFLITGRYLLFLIALTTVSSTTLLLELLASILFIIVRLWWLTFRIFSASLAEARHLFLTPVSVEGRGFRKVSTYWTRMSGWTRPHWNALQRSPSDYRMNTALGEEILLLSYGNKCDPHEYFHKRCPKTTPAIFWSILSLIHTSHPHYLYRSRQFIKY